MTVRVSVAAGAAVAAAVALAACGSGGSGRSPASGHPAAAITTGGKHVKLSTPGTPKGEQTVHIKVVATSTKPNRAAMALVPVYVNGQGPLPFALDTGAAKSLVSSELAKRLHLRDLGSAGELAGIAGSAHGEKVKVTSWRVGSVKLPAAVITAMSSAAAKKGATAKAKGPAIVGLLGSDVLSRYGKIAVDYDKGLLILDPPVK